MPDLIDYSNTAIMDVLRGEVCAALGEAAWSQLTCGIGVPDIDLEAARGCGATRRLIARLEAMAEADTVKRILTRVRHALGPAQFVAAVRKFEACGRDIDAFIRAEDAEQRAWLTELRDTGKDFYGQPITPAVYDFTITQPGMVSPVREGNRLRITGYLFTIAAYLKETDARLRRYHVCHCPFAKASILRPGEEVSPTLCHCSLGHAKVMWDTILGVDLEGEVETSVLRGDDLCRYILYLPDEVLPACDAH